jgi:hypothetical protein
MSVHTPFSTGGPAPPFPWPRARPRLPAASLILPAILVILSVLAMSCASVPQEAVVLSRLVGTQIAEHRASHEAFVRHYYAGSRDVVEMFLRDRWVPEYLDRFVAESEVMDLLTTPDEVFNEEQLERLREEIMAISGVGEVRTPLIVEAVSRVVGDAERGQIMLDFAEVALDEIESQRSELLEPLYLQEQEVLDRLADSYGQLQQAQAQLTAYLASAKDVTRSQDEVLEAMGMRQIRDDALEQAVWLSEELAAAARSGRSAEEAIERMRALIGSTGPG